MITLTENAARQIQKHLMTQDASALRIGVKKSGCSGYAYHLDFAKDISEQDLCFEDHGITLVVEKDRLPLLDGLTVDFVKQGVNETFRFINPNATGECGCGESFTV